jgi:hypothetical protein
LTIPLFGKYPKNANWSNHRIPLFPLSFPPFIPFLATKEKTFLTVARLKPSDTPKQARKEKHATRKTAFLNAFPLFHHEYSTELYYRTVQYCVVRTGAVQYSSTGLHFTRHIHSQHPTHTKLTVVSVSTFTPYNNITFVCSLIVIFILFGKRNNHNKNSHDKKDTVRTIHAYIMGNILGKEKPLKEVLRENKRMITRAIRELDREKTALEKEEKRLTMEIKKAAKEQQMTSVRIMAKVCV